MSEKISLEGLDKAAVLAALYNASKPQGMGFMHYNPKPMTTEEAEELLEGYGYFDYLKGRVMKVDLSGDELDPWGYDRDNGQGAASRAIAAMQINDVSAIHEAHISGTKNACENTRKLMGQESTKTGVGVELGLADVADVLGPRVDSAAADLYGQKAQ